MSNSVSHYGSSYPLPNLTSISQQRNGYSHHQHMPMAGLDALAEGSQYALQQQQQQQLRHNQSAQNNHYLEPLRSPGHQRTTSFSTDNTALHRQRSSSGPDGGGITKKSSQTPIRRRISRACDQCNQLRTKCDGKNPCAHCVGMSTK